jgi:crotonobetainyl-CoA:carnitine CoA-transferase CaiB-like acyl-CoA transferase
MAHDLPLADVKILDFTWVMAGPAATRVLADYGATVVRIESTHRLDTGRTIGPFHDGQPGVEHSGFFQNLNAGKLGLTLDLSQEAGREVARDLVRWVDVVTGYHGRQHGSSVPGQHSGGITSTCWRLSWAIVPSASRR